MKKKRFLGLVLATVFLASVMSPLLSASALTMDDYPYYKLNETIELPDGGYNLNTANIGIKTIYVNMKMFDTTNARYSADTEAAVKRFQSNNGLEATGEVDLNTWLKMGYSEEEWYGLGTYTHPVLTTKYSSREDIVNAMLIAAKANADEGTEYRVGSSGPAGTYTDCSGLIFQCLYAAGINPEKNIVDHALAVYEYTSRNLEADEKLGVRVARSEIKKGDLVFYQYNGSVCHVGIIDVDGKMYDSWPNQGVTYRNYTAGGNILCFKRVLPDYDEYLGVVPDNAVTGRELPATDNSMVLFETEGETVDATSFDILVKVSDENLAIDITLSNDLTVEAGEYVLGATGSHAEWILKNIHEGNLITITDYLVSSEELIPETEEDIVAEPEITEDVTTNDLSIKELIIKNQESYSGPFYKFSFFK